ncbi:CRISPR-associated endoribonuclease Cas6 [Thermosulfurimonas sp. F29]|uniref:CRISPR-associated endoribonuclease Cas6 n=1 Tax=Thermosulfurimonas sp. F29 TaxID=2867247 RepID=UPI001C82B816|nr:CRISPR-associated endoribonuclease Cas6 [Thermosulfurimonas sp. F29]MBX6423912.1 CRISPR-associated endoribonuclease Cas6 [Thermosulfurimonas sp. F29]
MRIKLSLEPKEKTLILPVHYNHLIQGMIYRNLDQALAQKVHEEGFLYGKRRFKLFTFSRLLSRKPQYLPERQELALKAPIHLWIGAVEVRLLESLASHLVRRGEIRLGERTCYLSAIEVEMPPEVSGPVRVRTLSPVTVHRTFGRYTRYYHPEEPEFEELILANLQRKALAFYGADVNNSVLEEAYIKPLVLKKEVITWFKPYRKLSETRSPSENSSGKGTLIKGWDGVFELYLPEPYFSLAYNAGLGDRNSQGFGMVALLDF